MAHFRGELKGSRGKVSRLGTKRSGLTLLAQTWGYNISVRLVYDEQADEDRAEVTMLDAQTGTVVWRILLDPTNGRAF